MQFLTVLLLIVYVIHTLHAAAANSPVKYPGPSVSSNSIDYNVAEECRNLTYCTIKPKNYPQDKYNWMFKNYKPIPQPALVLDVTFENRQGDPNAEDGCQSDVTFKPLYHVRQKRNDVWRQVVQAPEHDYLQRVRLETCKNPHASCFDVLLAGNQDFVTFCEQKYSTWKVLVDKGNNETEVIETDLPVCCLCKYKSV